MSLITKEFYDSPENRYKAAQIDWEIARCLAESGVSTEGTVAPAAYLMCKAKQDCMVAELTMKSVADGRLDIPEEILRFVREFHQHWLSEKVWRQLLSIAGNYTEEELALAAVISDSVSGYKYQTATPQSILNLTQCILHIQEREQVVDLCCGTGSFLMGESINQPQAAYFGCDINYQSTMIAKMCADLLDEEISIECCDVFQFAENANYPKADKIFSNYPFGMMLRNSNAGSAYMQRLAQAYPEFSKKTSSDWVFNALICDLLAEGGKAVAVMTTGAAQNSTDISMRKYLAERHMIESVITLPKRMFAPYTSIGTSLIVFSHGNEGIRLVDATKLCLCGRRQSEFGPQNIEAILDALQADGEYSRMISMEELRDNEYNLSLEHYTEEMPAFVNGVPFGEVTKSITRGASITASQLDDMVSHTATRVQYLMLANIQDGIIDDKLPYLTELDPKYDKYCLKNNDIILSKNGYPYKVAVAKVEPGQKILANGNLYIIEPDENRVNPYYIKAYFDSAQGIAVLKNISVGTTIPNIGVDKLKNIAIPLPSMEEQNRIAEKYQATLNEIVRLKNELTSAVDKLHTIFDEECQEKTL